MKRMLAAKIAWRYLRSKKSHGAVTTITTVSIIAMAVATAAIICVLSVFNGFQQVIASKLDSLSPDVMVTPAEGKAFDQSSELTERIRKMPEVEVATPTLSDNALIICNGQEMPVKIKGVIAEEYARVTSVRQLFDPDFGTYIDQPAAAPDNAIVSIGVAARLSITPDQYLLIFAPRRRGRVNLANPASSFLTDSLHVTGIYHTDQQQYDEDGVILPIEKARRLLQYQDQASAVEIKCRPGSDAEQVAQKIASALGSDYVVKDRARQQEMNFRMVKIEKWVSFLLLGFILAIAGFNIISSLSMLVIEKERGIATFSAIGLSRRQIGNIFAWESIYVALAGGISGIILGVTLCLIQQEFGLITLAGDPSMAIVTAYPVAVDPLDVLITLIPIIIIGMITAAITATFARSRIKQ